MYDYTALFKVTFCNEFNETKVTCGAINCSNFTHAMNQVEEYFGDDLIDCHIELIDQAILTFNEEIYNKIKEEY